MIGLVDYGCGNLQSLRNALEALGLTYSVISGPGDLARCEQAILPGVGHFGHAAEHLRRTGLDGAIRRHLDQDRPLLGICLGMQLLFEGSAESPGSAGLGQFPGRFELFGQTGLKVPHMGWNRVRLLPADLWMEAYFVHSYYLPAGRTPPGCTWSGFCAYGVDFLAAFRRGRLAACQFHPEKSGPRGLHFLREVLSWS